MAIPLLLFFKQVFCLVDLRNKLQLNTNQLACGSMLQVSSFGLDDFIASDVDEKKVLPQILRLNSWPLHYFVKLDQRKRWNNFNSDYWDKIGTIQVWLTSTGSDEKVFQREYWGNIGRTSSLHYLVPLWTSEQKRWGNLQRQIHITLRLSGVK